MIHKIYVKNGDYYTYDPDTQLISKNGEIVPYKEYEPTYITLGGDIPPIFSGIYSKRTDEVISLSGNINRVINNDNEVIL